MENYQRFENVTLNKLTFDLILQNFEANQKIKKFVETLSASWRAQNLPRAKFCLKISRLYRQKRFSLGSAIFI
jgi:hypothetical protein